MIPSRSRPIVSFPFTLPRYNHVKAMVYSLSSFHDTIQVRTVVLFTNSPYHVTTRLEPIYVPQLSNHDTNYVKVMVTASIHPIMVQPR